MVRSIYATWGVHDELGDAVPLTETLYDELLDRLAWLRDRGLPFEHSVLDYFWYDRARGYEHFDLDRFPGGPERAILETRERAGATLGLWYPLNGGSLNVPEWEASRAEDGWAYSLVDGPYREAFARGMIHAATEWGVRFFKLDFARVAVRARGHAPDPEAGMAALIRSTDALRAAAPDAYVIGHTGFVPGPWERFRDPETPLQADRRLGLALDRLFTGDPQPGDLPLRNGLRATDLYQDHQMWRFVTQGWAFDRVDDHGVLIGDTNTANYRGRRGFRRSHVGTLARGNRRDFVYGDLRLLTEEDAATAARARAVFFHAYFERGLTTRFDGAGEPGWAGPYAFVTGDASAGLVYVVNPGPASAGYRLPGPGRVLFHDGAEPTVRGDEVELGPEACAVIGVGEYADARWWIGRDEDAPALAPATRVAEGTTEGGVWRAPVPPGRLTVFVRNESGGFPRKRGNQDESKGPNREPRIHSEVVVTGPGEPVSRWPEVPIWSGVAWTSATFDAPSGGEVRVEGEGSVEVWRA